jgi:uncharacterized membrane protein
MKYSKWIGISGVIILCIAAYLPWVTILSKNITISGMDTAGTNFGKPALMNIIVSVISAVFFLSSSVMAKRANLFFSAFNIAWSIRNYVIVSMCRGGECPERKFGLYLLMIAAIVIMVASLFPDIKIRTEADEN